MIEATTDQEKIGRVLRWIVSLLTRYEIPYQICGGMAAKAYGATRPLVDIDFYAALQESLHFQEFLQEIHPYLIREWSPRLNASWDIIYLTLNYQGMQIEIGEATTNPRFYNHRDGRWEGQRINLFHVLDFGRPCIVLTRLSSSEVHTLGTQPHTHAPGS